MNKILTLIKYDIYSLINQSSKKTKKIIPAILLIFFVIFIMGYSYASITYYTITELKNSNIEYIALFSPLVTWLGFIGVFTISRSTLTTEKNSDFLLSLPIKKPVIVASKAISNSIFYLVLGFIFVLPSFIIYFVLVQQNIMILINCLVLLIVITLFANGITFLLNSFVNFFVVRFKYYKMIRFIIILISFLFFVYIMNFMTFDETSLQMFLISDLIDIVLNTNIIKYLILIFVSLSTFCISTVVFSKFYGRKAITFKSKNKNLIYNTSSKFKGLLMKEFKTYTNSTLYMFNTLMGTIFLIGGSIYILASDSISNFGESIFSIQTIAYMILGISLSMSCTSNVSISFEGKNLWILKSAPINPSLVLLSKATFNMILIFIASTISFILLLISNKFDLIPLVLLYLIALSTAVFISFIGLYNNLLFPKLNFKNDSEIVKSSTSVLITILPLILLSMIGPIFSFFYNLNVVLLIHFIISTSLSILSIVLVFTSGIKKYNEL